MATIFRRGPGLGASLGQALGTGLGGALQGLAGGIEQRSKLNQLMQGLQAQGIEPEEARGLAQLESQSPGYLQNFMKQQQMQAAQQQQQQAQQQREQAFGQILNSLLGAQQGQQESQPANIGSLKPGDMAQLARIAQQEKKLGFQEQALEERKQSRYSKETIKPYEEMINKGKNAREDKIRFKKLLALNKSPNIRSGKSITALEKVGDIFGVDTAAFMTADEQEMKKLTIDLLRNIKDFVGSRVTNFDLELFKDRLPKMTQTREGRERVINNLMQLSQLDIERSKVAQDIIKKNDGERPKDFLIQIDEKMKPIEKQLAKKFNENIKIPKTQRFSSLPDAAQYEGKIIRNPETGERMKSVNGQWLRI